MTTAILGKKVLFASDLSENSDKVFNEIIQIGPDLCEKLTIVHVISPETAGGFEETLPKLQQPVLDKQVNALQDAGFNAEGEFLYGLPYPVVNDYITDNNFDFLIVGAQGQSLFLKEIFLGNQVSNIISHLLVPGLIIKTGKKEIYHEKHERTRNLVSVLSC